MPLATRVPHSTQLDEARSNWAAPVVKFSGKLKILNLNEKENDFHLLNNGYLYIIYSYMEARAHYDGIVVL